jgi:hypothetical protein
MEKLFYFFLGLEPAFCNLLHTSRLPELLYSSLFTAWTSGNLAGAGYGGLNSESGYL